MRNWWRMEKTTKGKLHLNGAKLIHKFLFCCLSFREYPKRNFTDKKMRIFVNTILLYRSMCWVGRQSRVTRTFVRHFIRRSCRFVLTFSGNLRENPTSRGIAMLVFVPTAPGSNQFSCCRWLEWCRGCILSGADSILSLHLIWRTYVSNRAPMCLERRLSLASGSRRAAHVQSYKYV